jgi:hypothetical protein
MKDKKTVFVLGAGASCPYGYPSGAQLRRQICLDFQRKYSEYFKPNQPNQSERIDRSEQINKFIKAFDESSKQSIDLFMATRRKLAPIGKYIIAFEIFEAEKRSQFREKAKVTQEWYSRSRPESRTKEFVEKGYFQGEDWYLYLFNRLTDDLTEPDILPDFSDDRISFITFNYDRSLEQFLYESLSSLFEDSLKPQIIQCLKKLKILHVYGQIAPLKWQDSNEGVDYRPEISEGLLQKAANYIKTIYEQKESPDINEALRLLSQGGQIFFLGFGYAPENMDVLGLPGLIPQTCWVYGTAFGANDKEVKRIRNRIIEGLRTNPPSVKVENRIVIESTDCLDLLRNYLD